MKVSPLHCVYLFAICTQLGACGSAVDTSDEHHLGQTDGTYQSDVNSALPASDTPLGDVAQPSADAGECSDPCAEHTECGQICLTLKGAGSSCQLVPTANDLTRPPRSVRFDCDTIPQGADGYDFDSLGHITLTGSVCTALQKGGPHRVTLTLACPPPPSSGESD
ncbi:MAG TPA: hypothetical protein VER96_16660 [Polyangiaceae bacterium]|nr:hypothetical protein [Polyangiaceae bacterium]